MTLALGLWLEVNKEGKCMGQHIDSKLSKNGSLKKHKYFMWLGGYLKYILVKKMCN